MIIAGPCLLNDNQAEIDNCVETARQLHAIDPDIRFRCKLWGGGTMPERYKEGIGNNGLRVLKEIKDECGLRVGLEIRDVSQFEYSVFNKHHGFRHNFIWRDDCFFGMDFIWIAARSCQNYELLKSSRLMARVGQSRDGVSLVRDNVLIKRGPGITIDEMIGIHDICRDIHGYTPTMIERGINTFCRTPEDRYTADFDGMMRVLHERPDINLMFDPSHCCGRKEYIFPMVKAACAIGVKSFMLEVYADPTLTQTDKAQALSVEEFKEIYEYVQNNI